MTASGTNTNLTSISASGHHLPPDSLKLFGRALSTQANNILKQWLRQQGNNSNGINNNDNDDKAAASTAGDYSGITSLAIGSKDMGNEGIIALCEGLQQHDESAGNNSGGLLQFIDFGWKNM